MVYSFSWSALGGEDSTNQEGRVYAFDYTDVARRMHGVLPKRQSIEACLCTWSKNSGQVTMCRSQLESRKTRMDTSLIRQMGSAVDFAFVELYRFLKSYGSRLLTPHVSSSEHTNPDTTGILLVNRKIVQYSISLRAVHSNLHLPCTKAKITVAQENRRMLVRCAISFGSALSLCRSHSWRPFLFASLASVMALGLLGCEKHESARSQQAQGPVEVAVVTVEPMTNRSPTSSSLRCRAPGK